MPLANSPSPSVILRRQFDPGSSSTGGTPPGADSSPGDDLSGAATATSGWSDLPIDLLLSILQRLEIPQALAFAAVCTSWCSAATAAGIPRSRGPWLVSWANFLEQREFQVKSGMNWVPEAATCKFRHLLDVDKVYNVKFPKGCFVACCGASHGWLFLVNDLSNIVLFNPFTSYMIPFPPITDFACVRAVYDSGGNLKHYLFARDKVYQPNYLGTWFYQKAVLSCSPSNGGDYIAMVIHGDADWISFVRAGERQWKTASVLGTGKTDRYTDCAYHNGRFYIMTLHGRVDKWDLDAPDGPTKEAIIEHRHHAPVLTRHLMSTPWGDLLQVRVIYTNAKSRYPDNVKFQIRKVDLKGCKNVSKKDLGDHAIFIGLNHSACLPTENLPGVRSQFIYFSAPWMTRTIDYSSRIHDWGGVRAFDPEKRTFKRVFPFGGMCDSLSIIYPSEVWITPNI